MEKRLVGMVLCGTEPIEYYLLVEKLENEIENYGIMIRYKDDLLQIPGISIFYSQIEALLELLLRGSVTPVTGRDVVEDWLDFSCNFL